MSRAWTSAVISTYRAESYSQLHHGRAGAAFVLRRLGDGRHLRMLLEILTQGFAQHAHAAAVDDAHARQPGEEGAVEEFFHAAGGLIHIFADDVDLAGRRGIFGDFHLNAAGTRRLHGRRAGARQNLGNVGAGNAHGHFAAAQLDFKILIVNTPPDESGAAQRFEFDSVAFADVAYRAGNGVRIAGIGAGLVRHHRGIELLFELAAQAADAAFGVFG